MPHALHIQAAKHHIYLAPQLLWAALRSYPTLHKSLKQSYAMTDHFSLSSGRKVQPSAMLGFHM